MHIASFYEMALFRTDLDLARGQVIVTYVHPDDMHHHDREKERRNTLHVPLSPTTDGLARLEICMHNSSTKGYDMGPHFNDWFSARFGFKVRLAYLGENSRPVLGSFSPSPSSSAFSVRARSVLSMLSSSSPTSLLLLVILVIGVVLSPSWPFRISLLTLASLIWNTTNAGDQGKGGIFGLIRRLKTMVSAEQGGSRITFADCAAYLVASETSLHDVTARLRADHIENGNHELAEEEEMEVTKFRPNIVISGASTPYEEDFWSELTVNHRGHEPSSSRLMLTANCVRCKSLNVDYLTGKQAAGPAGTVLKKLMKDRRVDKGARYSPVFGRYGFLAPGGSKKSNPVVSVGDPVSVSKVATERSVFGESVSS